MDHVRRQDELVNPTVGAARITVGACLLIGGLILVTLLGGCADRSRTDPPLSSTTAGPAPPVVVAAAGTEAVADDPDDPAIWVHPTDPQRSVILGTNKVAAPAGAVVAFGLDGRIRQTIGGIDRPNNVDIEYRVQLGAEIMDVAVVTERLKHRLRVFRIDPADGRLVELGSFPVLVGETGDRQEPMGIALYRRPSDGAFFAIVAPKSGGASDYLWQYAVSRDAHGRLAGRLVRRFGTFSQKGSAPDEPGEIEAVVVDDALGYVYYADERYGIRKWFADPAHPAAAQELAVFGTAGYIGDREGLALYTREDGTGYLVSSDQVPHATTLKFYPREGAAGAPHDHMAGAFDVKTTADETDGLDVTSRPLPGFPGGLVVTMNSTAKNFLLFSWDAVMAGRPARTEAVTASR